MVCTNPHHPFSYPSREVMYRDLREAKREAENLRQQQQGYIGGIGYALRLLNSPRPDPDRAPINLLAAQMVLRAMLNGETDRYVSMAQQARALADQGEEVPG